MDGVYIALISGIVTLITSLTSSILVFKNEQKKIKADQDAKQQKQIDEIHNTLVAHKKEYMEEINDVKDSITQMQAIYQQNTAIVNLQIENLTKQVEKHNKVVERTYALERRTDVQEEMIKVANHRIEDLEKK